MKAGEIEISIYRNIFDKTSRHTITIDRALDRIKSGKSAKAIIDLRNEADENRQSMLKEQLVSVLWSGLFDTRTDAGLITHSGFICLDFDHVSVPETKEKLSKWAHTYACWISPRGNGVKALVRIAEPKKHMEHFLALRDIFPEIDAKCGNISRVCYESYDAEIYINESAKVFSKVKVKEQVTERTVNTDTYEIFKKIQKWLEKKGEAFTSGNRNEYVFKLASALCRFGVSETEANNLLQSEFTETTFKHVEIERTVRSAYKKNQDKYGSAEFSNETVVERSTTIQIDPAILLDGATLKDVIYGVDAYQDALEIYQHGYKSAETTYVNKLDEFFKFKRGELTLLTGIGNHGKALSVDTDIPTLEGWKKMKDIKVGDVIFDENGKQCNVIYATEEMLNHNCYKVKFSDGTVIIADEEHFWMTDTAASIRSKKNAIRNNRINERELKPRGTDQRSKRTFATKKTTLEILNTLIARQSGNRIEYNHSIPLCGGLEIQDKDLLLHPYVLGAWLGDGTSADAGFTCDDTEIVEQMRGYGYDVKKGKVKFHYHIMNIRRHLVSLDVLNNKHIPMAYLRSSRRQRLDLLSGLMDTDGHIDDNGICEFCNTNKTLAYQVYELITSLGLKATINEYDAKLYGRVVSKKYRICFKPFFNVFKLSRKAAKVKSKVKNKLRYIISVDRVDTVPVKCIQVDSKSHLYLCSKSFIATHNTTYLNQLFLIKSYFDNTKWATFSPENFPAAEYYFDLTEMLIGTACNEGAGNKPPQEYFDRAYKFVSEHFYYVYPDKLAPTPTYIKTKFMELILKEKIDGVLIDPFNQLTNDYNSAHGRDDKYLETFLSDCKRFAQENNIYFFIIAHPHKLQKQSNGNYPCPDVYELAGGAMWNNKCDNILTYHRPFGVTDPENPLCEHHSKKIRRQKMIGKKGFFEFELNKKKRRFLFDGKNPLSGNSFEYNLGQPELVADDETPF